MKIGVLLSGCGVYDGAEIHETVLTLLAIAEMGAEAICIGVDRVQHHVIDHTNGEEMAESRNMLKEAARIARGDIREIKSIEPADIDALVIPGGFGSAKNFTTWAFDGPNSEILPEVKLLIVNLINIGKPITALCVSPVVLAKALEKSSVKPDLTIGSDKEESPYDIKGFTKGMESIGATTIMKSKSDIHIDEVNKIVTAPCYMMETDLVTLRKNIYDAIHAMTILV